MRVLILSQYFWPESFRISDVATALRDAGCKVSVLTGQPNYPDGDIFEGYSGFAVSTEKYEGLDVFRVPIIPRGEGSALRLVLNYVSFVFSAAMFGPWVLRRHPFDAIFVFAPSPILQVIPAILLARLKGACLVTWVQDLWPESLSATGFVKNPWLLGWVSRLVGWIYKRNELLLVQSRAFIEPVQQMAGDVPVVYHPNPGDPVTDPHVLEREDGLVFSAEDFNVVFAGNIGTVQAIDSILDAAELLKSETDIKFFLVGSGSRSEWARQEVSRRGLMNVVLPGRFPAEAMPSIFAKASALLVSLKRDPIMSQTVPSKVQAYLAAQKPIIAALDGEGAKVILEAGAGVACPAEDAPALAAATRQLRDAPLVQRERMGSQGLDYYRENFEPTRLAAQLAGALQMAVERAR